MAGEWHSYKIGELGKVITGKTPSTTEPENFGGPYPFITIPDLVQKVYIDTSERTLSEIGASKMKTLLLPPNSVMMSCIATIGKCGITTKPSFTNQQINSVICNPDIVDPLFLYYVFTQIGHQLESAGGGGSVYTNVSKSRFSEISVLLPPLPEQRTIAAVLGALDDKIELNRRMNRTLEAIAQAVFRHWFVENEEAEGWEVGRLGDLVTLVNERIDPTPQKDNERYIALDDMPSKSIDLSQYRLGLEVNSSITRFKKGDILFGSMRPYFHKVGIAPFDGITRTTTFVLRPKEDLFRAFALYWFFSDEVIEFSTTSSVGTTIPYVRWETLAEYEIPLPPRELMSKFSEFFQPLWLKIVSNGEQSRTLAALRDALLPKLMRGEVRVTVHE